MSNSTIIRADSMINDFDFASPEFLASCNPEQFLCSDLGLSRNHQVPWDLITSITKSTILNTAQSHVLYEVSQAIDMIAEDWFANDYTFEGQESVLDFSYTRLCDNSFPKDYIENECLDPYIECARIRECFTSILQSKIEETIKNPQVAGRIAQMIISFQEHYLDDFGIEEFSFEYVLEYAEKVLKYALAYFKEEDMIATPKEAFTWLSQSNASKEMYEALFKIVSKEAFPECYEILKDSGYKFEEEFDTEDCEEMLRFNSRKTFNLVDPQGRKLAVWWQLTGEPDAGRLLKLLEEKFTI